MKKFSSIKSIPAYLPIVNIDTDMIIPKQFLKTIKRTGLGKNLFFEMRYDQSGKVINDFILNNSPYDKVSWKWIWSGPHKRFTRSITERGFFKGEPYIYQHLIEDYEPVYVRRKKSSN